MVLVSGGHMCRVCHSYLTHTLTCEEFVHFFLQHQALNILESFKINSLCPWVSKEGYEMIEEH